MSYWTAPPEFEPDGSPPPHRTQPWLLSVNYTVCKATLDFDHGRYPAAELMTFNGPLDEVSEGAKEWLNKDPWIGMHIWAGNMDRWLLSIKLRNLWWRPGFYPRYLKQLWRNWQIRRRRASEPRAPRHLDLLCIIRHAYWERDASIIQLPPGTSSTFTSERMLGLSVADSQELSAAIGIKAGLGKVADLSGNYSVKWLEALTAAEQIKQSRELKLEASSDPSLYRRFAIWSQRHLVRVGRLYMNDVNFSWAVLNTANYGVDTDPFITSIDIPRARRTACDSCP